MYLHVKDSIYMLNKFLICTNTVQRRKQILDSSPGSVLFRQTNIILVNLCSIFPLLECGREKACDGWELQPNKVSLLFYGKHFRIPSLKNSLGAGKPKMVLRLGDLKRSIIFHNIYYFLRKTGQSL